MDKIIVKDAMSKAHDEKHRIAVWFWHPKKKLLDISFGAVSHADSACFKHNKRADVADWLHGRVIRVNDAQYAVAYLQNSDFQHLSKSNMQALFKSIHAHVTITAIIDQSGKMVESKHVTVR